MAESLTVDIVAPDSVLWAGQAERVSAPTVEGEIGLLANHEPILSVLGAGNVRVRGIDGQDHSFAVAGGFISFDHNTITVVVDEALPDQVE
ncbi:MAG: ATP synthase F1 subunit epsilon [Actinobacteria bacterium HGW-Actinobacteria-4]|nr:MAG: ATP synthase F1 subunit epsilon [Actinobacteria bacterium HGW-Actinobacteria-4]